MKKPLRRSVSPMRRSGVFTSNSLPMDPVHVHVDGREGQSQRTHSNGPMADDW